MEGQQTGPRVLIVEHDEDMAELLEVVLRQEGFVPETRVVGPDEVVPACALPPALIIVDLPNQRPDEESPLLDDLRVSPTCRGVPVLALASQDAVADAAYASYNVTATLTKPFDIEDLTAKVNEALRRPPLHASVPTEAPPEGILAEAEAILARHSRNAIFRWIRRLQTTEPWSTKKELRLPELLDSVPVLVEALDLALHYGSADEVFEKHPEVARRAAHHAWLRHSQGIDLRSIIREYSLLREELWDTLADHFGHDLRPENVRTLSKVINGTVDKIVEVAVPTWGAPRSDEER